MEIKEQCIKAAGIAARVLGISTPYRITFDGGTTNTPVLGREVEIHVDLSALPPVSPLALFDGLVDGDVGGELCSALFETYRQMRFLYQREVLTNYYRNLVAGWQAYRQRESNATCEEWDRDLNGYHVKEAESPCEQDATAFAYYMLHRYPVQFRIKKSGKRLGQMRRRYNRVKIPEAFNAPL